MKTTYTNFFRLYTLCLLLAGVQVQAQAQVPYSSPTTTVSVSTPRTYQFDLERNRLNAMQGFQAPSWRIFWEFGDGYCAYSDSPMTNPYRISHTFYPSSFAAVPTYVVRANGHPVYSPDTQPPAAARVNQSAPAPASGTAPQMLSSGIPVLLNASWNRTQVRRGEKITVVIFYQGMIQQGSQKGTVRLKYNEKAINPVSSSDWNRRYFGEAAPVIQNLTGGSTYNKEVVWNYDNLNLNADRALYLDMIVGDGVLLSTVNLQAEVAGPITGPATSNMSMRIGVSNDPNGVSTVPHILDRNGNPVLMRCRVDFENIGDGFAHNILIKLPIPKALDQSSIQLVDHAVLPPGGTEQFSYTEDDTLRYELRNVLLPGAGMEGLTNPAYARGFFTFDVYTSPSNFPVSDSLGMSALIKFDSNPYIATQPAWQLYFVDPTRPSNSGFTWPEWLNDCNRLYLLIGGIALLLLLLILLILLARRRPV
ncbi:MAG: hypothetical protein EAZ89_16815 [Bacteroidetes bacterium]|nr:MAG: hypothetical protein EAZ89_16815 [Bacteroidota bacterium]